MVDIEEVNSPEGRYRVVLDKERGVEAFCNNGPEAFGLICGFHQDGFVSVRHPFNIILGPLVYQGSYQFQEKYKEGQNIRKNISPCP